MKEMKKEILEEIVASGTAQQRHTSIIASALLKEITLLVDKTLETMPSRLNSWRIWPD
jgi:hypothetical protein